MDIRIEKTRRAIRNAFLSLLGQKKLEQITVTELCHAAEIDKSTFYLHYRDLFDLCSQLQQDAVRQFISHTTISDSILDNLPQFLLELQDAIVSEWDICAPLFSGTQRLILPVLMEQALKEALFQHHPEYRDDVQINVTLSYQIFGAYYSCVENLSRFDHDSVIRAIHKTHAVLCRKQSWEK